MVFKEIEDKDFPETVQQELKSMGYKVEPHTFEFGNMQLVTRMNGKLTAASYS